MYSRIRSALVGTTGMVAMAVAVVWHIDGDTTGAVLSMGCAVLLFLIATVIGNE